MTHKNTLLTILLTAAIFCCFTGCSEKNGSTTTSIPSSASSAEAVKTEEADVTAEGTSAATTSETTVSSDETEKTEETTRPTTVWEKDHDYDPSGDNWYNLNEFGVPIDMLPQDGGTCWIFAGTASMKSGYFIEHGKTIDIDPLDLLPVIYDNDRDEGLYVHTCLSRKDFGGFGFLIEFELSNGFGDGLALDRAIEAYDWTSDQIKEGIMKYGGLYVGVPDTDPTKKGWFDGYRTINHPTDDPDCYDHSVMLIGWDDDFPKEYFKVEASQDGAWIAYNSQESRYYYYISYDTHFDTFLEEGKTAVANVFHGKGTLAAVGTYSLSRDQEITIEVLSADLSEVLYTQDAVLEYEGYYTVRLDTPLEVEDYAIAIHYSSAAPVEGTNITIDEVYELSLQCEEGQSFVFLDGTWKDLSLQETTDELGTVTHNCCIKALYE